MIYDVIIIGAGVSGTAIARALSRYQLKIAILEKEEELAFGVSKSNSGIIHPGTQNPARSLKGKLCVQGNKLIRRIAKDLGVDFKEVGELIVAFTDEDLLQLKKLKREGQALGVPGLKIVHRPWLRKHEPNLSQEAIAALFAPSAGIISPYRLVYDMAENAIKNGVEIYTQSKVTQITHRKNLNDHEKSFFEILTPTTTFTTRYLVNAAGLFADEIAAMLGIDDFKITPRKGEEYILDKKKERLAHHLLFPIPTKTSKGVLIIKTADGNPMIGPTAQQIQDKEDWSTTEEGLANVLKGAQRMIPVINAKDIIAYFAGSRPVAGDDFIIRHEDKVPGLITVAGIQSPGLTAAPAIALFVCTLLKTNGLSLTKKRIFYPHRKKTVHLFSTPFSKTKQLIKENSSYGDIVCRCEMVSAKEIHDAIARGAKTLDGIKFRTRAQAGRCHGGFCTTRIMKILSATLDKKLTDITKKGSGSEIVLGERTHDHP